MKKHLKKVRAIYLKSKFDLCEIFLFGVLRDVDYSTLYSLVEGSPKDERYLQKNWFSPYLFTVAMETLISTKIVPSKLLPKPNIWYEIQIH